VRYSRPIDFAEKEITVRSGKNDKSRIIPIGEKALSAIKDYLSVRNKYTISVGDEDALFITMRPGYEIKRMNRNGILKNFCAYKRKAGIKKTGGVHTLRATFASHLLRHGASIQAIQRMLGHERVDTSAIYTYISDKDLKAIIMKTDKYQP
jgi:site-specific recombinase XerD